MNRSGGERPACVIKIPNPVPGFVVKRWNVQPGNAVIAAKAEILIHAPGANTLWRVDDRWELQHTPAL